MSYTTIRIPTKLHDEAMELMAQLYSIELPNGETHMPSKTSLFSTLIGAGMKKVQEESGDEDDPQTKHQ